MGRKARSTLAQSGRLESQKISGGGRSVFLDFSFYRTYRDLAKIGQVHELFPAFEGSRNLEELLPLRARHEDVPALVAHFIEIYGRGGLARHRQSSISQCRNVYLPTPFLVLTSSLNYVIGISQEVWNHLPAGGTGLPWGCPNS